jgi:hypothetical protein
MNSTLHTLGEASKLLLHQNFTLIKEKETLVKVLIPWKMHIGNNERNIKRQGKTCY